MAVARRCLFGLVLLASACATPAGETPSSSDSKLTTCLDTPGKLELPPNGRLPCELIPPGLTLK